MESPMNVEDKQMPVSKSNFLKFVKAFDALSEPVRLRVLCLIMQEERCVCEVEQLLGIPQTRASRALKVLREAGFLKLRKAGLWSEYSVDREGMPECAGILVANIEKCLE